MTRWIAVAAVTAMTVGCDEAPRTIPTAKPVSTGDATKAAIQIAPGKAPEKSDPKAVELVAAAVAAHTGGKPELLQKFKTVRYLREGKVSAGGLAPSRPEVGGLRRLAGPLAVTGGDAAERGDGRPVRASRLEASDRE